MSANIRGSSSQGSWRSPGEPGQTVLEVATGTGIAAFAAAEVVGKSGGKLATDISPHMLDRARERLANFQNSSFSTEDGQALSFPDQSFDAVICNMGLMYFPDPGKGVKEFYRVLRKSGRATVSVFHGSGAAYRLSSGREFGRASDTNRGKKSVERTARGRLHKVRRGVQTCLRGRAFKRSKQKHTRAC